MSDRSHNTWHGSDKHIGEASLILVAFMIVGLVFIDYAVLFMIAGVVSMSVDLVAAERKGVSDRNGYRGWVRKYTLT
jgi:hypothetical protein